MLRSLPSYMGLCRLSLQVVTPAFPCSEPLGQPPAWISLTYGSVCSGIEAVTVAWEPLGFRPAWFAEIDPFCSVLLAHQHPGVPNLGDFTTIKESHAPIDVLAGGTPCQSFSLAGRRGGLEDARGNLAIEFAGLLAGCGLAGSSGKTSPVFCPQTAGGTSAPSSGRWRNSGMVAPGECWTLSSSECPSDGVASSLSDILETGGVPQRYFLSAKACAGILRRAAKRGKTLPPLLRMALEHVARMTTRPRPAT